MIFYLHNQYVLKTSNNVMECNGNSKWGLCYNKNDMDNVLEYIPAVWTYNTNWEMNTHVCKEYLTSKQWDVSDFQLYQLKTPVGKMPIFTHNPKKDGISMTISKVSEHEPHTDAIIRTLIGANIGIRSFQVLRFKKRVIALEASEINIRHICLTSALNEFSHNVTVIYNALSNKHGDVKFAVGSKGDQSGNFVVDSSDLTNLKRKEDGEAYYKTLSKTIPAVTLDDIVDLPVIVKQNPKEIFIKLDVEGYEDVVLSRSKKLFEKFKVIGIVLEWRWHKTRKSALEIITFMKEQHMIPYTYDRAKLDTTKYQSWSSHDILWLPM